MSVSRETGPPIGTAAKLGRLERRYALSDGQTQALRRLLTALSEEPSPPTAVSEQEGAVDVHLADSLAGLEVEGLARAARIADVGSGAGFPGLVLALALPATEVDLIEASRRKCEVIARLARAARLSNATARAVRAEELPCSADFRPYDAVTARAVAPLAVLVEYAAPLLAEAGTLIAWKGHPRQAEQSAGRTAAAEVGLREAAVLRVQPYEGAGVRRLYVYSKVRQTPDAFPRRPGMAVKRPLGIRSQSETDSGRERR